MARTISTGSGLIIIAAAVGLIGYCASHEPATNDTNKAAAVTAQPKLDPAAARAAARERTLKKLAAVQAAMAEFKAAAIPNLGMAGASVALDSFRLGATALQEVGTIGDLSIDEIKQARAVRDLLRKRQREAFPAIRKAIAKDLSKTLWEQDIKVAAIGDRSSVLSFIGGAFAANRNIAEMQKTFGGIMESARFKQSRYRWHDGADEFTYFDLKPPKDDSIEINFGGKVGPVDLKYLDGK